MRVVVIGSGLIGVTTAYMLARAGCEVVVLDREDGPGQRASFANGGLLTPSMSSPWNAPGVWKELAKSLFMSNAPLKLKARALPSLLGRGSEFLRNSRLHLAQRNAVSNLRLALRSLEVLRLLDQEVKLDYGHAARGALRIFRDDASMQRAQVKARELESVGLVAQSLTAAETAELEPGLAPIADQLAGAIHYVNDESGDARQFCVALAQHAQRLGVEFHFSSEVRALHARNGFISAVANDQRLFESDAIVVAAGSESANLLRSLGIRLPVRPLKGYSVTFDCPAEDCPLCIPLVDDALHAAVVPLGGQLRVAGTAEFAGFDLSIDPVRIRSLLALLHRILPQYEATIGVSAPASWCGLRPMSPDGVPVISATRIPNLFLNTGHGHLGWTLAAGSAELISTLVMATRTPLDPAPYSFSRFDHNA